MTIINEIEIGESNGMIAIVSGQTGQDGSFLTELLLKKGYRVIGLVRRVSIPNDYRVSHLFELEENHSEIFKMDYWDLIDDTSIRNIIDKYKPTHWFNTAAMSVSGESRLPIKSNGKIEHPEFKKLWKNYSGKNKIRIEKIDNVKVEVIDLPKNKNSYALGYWNGQGTWFPIKQISRHKYNGKIARMTQKYGRIEVTPNHSIYNTNQELCTPESNPELLNIRKLNYYNDSNKKDVLRTKLFGNLIKCKLKSYLRFIGAFISEGSTCYNKANRSYVCSISNNEKTWLDLLKKDLKKFSGISARFTTHKASEKRKNVNYELTFNSRKVYEYLRKECGTKSGNKKIPINILKLKDEYLKILFNKMIEGDGSINKYGLWSYGTSSYELACQVSILSTILRYDYTIDINDHKNKPKWNTVYNIRQCLHYKTNNKKDKREIEWIDYDDYVYDIGVDEVHNFAIGLGNIVVHNSHVAISFPTPIATAEYNAVGVTRILEAIRTMKPDCKFLQCSSSEMFGLTPPPQDELSYMKPSSPYGAAKVYAYHMTRIYREGYGLHACNSICFNHEGIRRGVNFVTRKITINIAEIVAGKRKKITLGYLDAKRDWGDAKDYVKAMEMIINHDVADDFVIATRETHTIKEYLNECFSLIGLNWKDYVEISDKFKRPLEVPSLLGDPTKILKTLNWKPKISYKQMIKEMLINDLRIHADLTGTDEDVLNKAREIMK